MPRYHIHLAVEHTEPMPPADALPKVEADDPVSAVETLLAQGRFSQGNPPRWARVVMGARENGQPRHVLRVPLESSEAFPIPSLKRDDKPAV